MKKTVAILIAALSLISFANGEELFADVTNEGLKAPRAYQAYWDYDYPLDEIARFLGVGERQVQALLDEWDQI